MSSLLSNIPGKVRRAYRHPSIIRNRFRKWMSDLRIDSRFGRGYSFLPGVVSLVPTLSCNMHCRTCGLPDNLTHPDRLPAGTAFSTSISVEEMNTIVDRLAVFRPVIQVGGGEPLVYEHTPAIIHRISRKHGLFSSLMTNGILLEDRIEALTAAGLSYLHISIDGVDDTYDAVRGAGNFEHLTRSLNRLNRLREKGGAPDVTAIIAVNPFNQHDLIRTVEWIFSQKIHTVLIQHMVSITPAFIAAHTKAFPDPYDGVKWTWGEDLKYSEIDVRQLRKSLRRIEAVAETVPGARVQYMPAIADDDLAAYYHPEPLPQARRKPCLMFWKSAFIYPDGSVMPSQGCYFHSMGNLLEEPFREIWNGAAYRELRKRARENGWMPICDRCYFPYGGCL